MYGLGRLQRDRELMQGNRPPRLPQPPPRPNLHNQTTAELHYAETLPDDLAAEHLYGWLEQLQQAADRVEAALEGRFGSDEGPDDAA